METENLADNLLNETNDTAIISASASKAKAVQSLGWIIFLAGILYYCFAYLLRVYPSVMEYQLREYFHTSAAGFGLLTAFYYFAYAPMQLPVGVSVDRIGPRKSLIFACIVSTFGVTLFAYVHDFYIALLGRFLVGFGAAFAYVTALKLASIWLPRKYFATATGMVTGCGMVAAIFTYNYLTHTVETHGFQHAMLFPLFIGVAIFALITLLIRDKNKFADGQNLGEAHAVSYQQLWYHLGGIIKNRQMWLIGIVGFLLYLPSSTFLDVWAIPFLHYTHGMNAEQAALGVSVMLGGWICSSFASCAISDIFGSRKIPLVIACAGAALFASLILYLHNLPVYLLYSLLFCFGLFCGPHPLCFTLSKENNSHKISGTAVAFANFIIMMGGFIFQPVIGDILDLLWHGKIVDGMRYYSTLDYNIALSILPLGLIIAFVLTLFIRETYNNSIE